MHKIALGLVILLLFPIAVSAGEILQVNKESVTIHAGEFPTIDLTITSNIDDVFVVATKGERPWMSIPIHIQANRSRITTATLSFSPFLLTAPSIYKLELALESLLTGRRLERNLSIVVRIAEIAIEKIQTTGTLEPNGFGEVELSIKNYEDASTDLVLDTIVGPTDLLRETEGLSLLPRGFIVLTKNFSIPKCQKAGEYIASSEITSRGRRIFTATDNFTIGSKFIPVTRRNVTQSVLQSNVEITVENLGNIPGIVEITEDVLGSLFFSGDQPTRIENGTYKWILEVQPCQTRTISYQVDYSSIAAAIFILLAAWYIFFRLRTVKIRKVILQKSKIEKGFEFTVGIDIKSHTKLRDVEVRDFIPGIFDVKDTPGIRPIKRRTPAGTELIWRFNEIHRREERVLDYKIIPLFSMSGTVRLPAATVTFTHFGRRITRSSAKASLGMEMMKVMGEAGHKAGNAGKKLKDVFRKK